MAAMVLLMIELGKPFIHSGHFRAERTEVSSDYEFTKTVVANIRNEKYKPITTVPLSLLIRLYRVINPKIEPKQYVSLNSIKTNQILFQNPQHVIIIIFDAVPTFWSNALDLLVLISLISNIRTFINEQETNILDICHSIRESSIPGYS